MRILDPGLFAGFIPCWPVCSANGLGVSGF